MPRHPGEHGITPEEQRAVMAAVIAEPRARGHEGTRAPAGAIAARERFRRSELPPIRDPRE